MINGRIIDAYPKPFLITNWIFEFIRYDQAKPGILRKLGPIANDAIGGLIAGVSSRIYSGALEKQKL